MEWILFQLSLEMRLQPPLTLCSLSETLRGHLDCNLLRDSVPDDPHWTMPVILTHRDCEIINVCCHYMLFFKKWNSRLKAINKINGSIYHSILDEKVNH